VIRGAGLRFAVLLGAALAAAGAPSPAHAQTSSLVGRTLRIWAPAVTQKRIEGTLVAALPSELVLAQDQAPGDTLTIEFKSVRIVEVAEGKRSNMLLGAVGGMAAGGAVGAVAGMLGKRDDGSGDDRFNGLAFGLGVGVGFVVGTLVGIHSESQVWKRIPPDRLHLGLRPRPGGAPHVDLRLRF
jgi:hypothetical protein